MRCAGPQMQLSALARREYAMRRTCTQAPHSCIAYRAPSAGAGPLPVPEHARTRVPPSRPSHCGCTRFRSGPASHGIVRDDVWLYQYVLFESVPTVPFSSSPASALAFDFRVGRSEPGAPALLTATLCPDRGTAEPSCTPHVCRVQPKHPCITCRCLALNFVGSSGNALSESLFFPFVCLRDETDEE